MWHSSEAYRNEHIIFSNIYCKFSKSITKDEKVIKRTNSDPNSEAHQNMSIKLSNILLGYS